MAEVFTQSLGAPFSLYIKKSLTLDRKLLGGNGNLSRGSLVWILIN